MSISSDAASKALSEIDKLKRSISLKRTKQIQSQDERVLLKAVAHAWFNSHRAEVSYLKDDLLAPVDSLFHWLLEAGDKYPTRVLVTKKIADIRRALIELRKNTIQSKSVDRQSSTADVPPNFSKLVVDQDMQIILSNRWNECALCIQCGASLAATVMIGGLIEGLLLMRINQEPQQSKIFKAKSAPIYKQTGKPKQISDWKLSDFINLAHELKWVTKPTKEISSVLREYRNYIHPHKELADKVALSPSDTSMFWELAKNVTRQLLGTV